MVKNFILLPTFLCFWGQTILVNAQKETLALESLMNAGKKWDLTATDLQSAIESDRYTSTHNGVTHIYLQQRHAGIPVHNAIAGVHLKPDGTVAYATHSFIKDLAKKINTTEPTVLPAQAVGIAATHLGVATKSWPLLKQQLSKHRFLFHGGEISRSDIETNIMYFPTGTGQVRLAWNFAVDHPTSHNYWNILVDALDGTILYEYNWTTYCSPGEIIERTIVADDCPTAFSYLGSPGNTDDATYHVFPFPVESPIHGTRSLVSSPADPIASPLGWHDTDGVPGPEYTITRGNNTHAYLDLDGDNQSNNDEPNGGAGLTFDFPYDPNQEPNIHRNASVTQLFYANNFMHDFAYHYGFDEQAGNFQEKNYTTGGKSGDAVVAHSQDGEAQNNANFTTPPDGGRGRMQMYLWDTNTGKVLHVTEPLEVIGSFETGAASFGPSIDTVPISGFLVEAFDGSNDPKKGCSDYINPEEVNGKIALVDRGVCFFEEKAVKAEAAGAIALIICNFENSTIGMAGVTQVQDPTIPTISIGLDDCEQIRRYLNQGVKATLQIVRASGPKELDASFDNGVIAHEFGHGISNRLTGGPSQSDCLNNGEQAGEGWSDFFTLVTSVKSADERTKSRGIGNFVTQSAVNRAGVRRYPYATDMTINGLTYDDIIGASIHSIGEVWANMLWDLYWVMSDNYGWDPDQFTGDGGNNKAIQLVFDGFKLQKCQPGFIDARDAILMADSLNNGGANACDIWEVFARRGLGWTANQGNTNTANDGSQGFDVYPLCDQRLKIQKEMTDLIQAGDKIKVTLTIDNHKAAVAEETVVTDLLPDNTIFVNGSVQGVSDFVLQNDALIFNLGDVAVGERKIITYELASNPALGSQTLFFDDMEMGDLNWFFDVLKGSDIWEISDKRAKSGSKAWYAPTTIDENDQTLYFSQSFTVTGEQPVLRFFHYYDTEPGVDGGLVQISTREGAWENVEENIFRVPYRGKLSYGTFAIPNLKAFWGKSEGFVASYIDLSPYKGKDINVRFRFGAEEEPTGGAETGEGWYIDDVEVIDMLNYNSQACVRSKGDIPVCVEASGKGSVVNSNMSTPVEDITNFAWQYTVAPNPVKDQLSVTLTAQEETAVLISLHTLDGRTLQQVEQNLHPGFNHRSLNVNALPAGMYVLKVQDGRNMASKKIIKLHE